MRCEEVRNLIHAYVDRELDWKTRAQLFAHFRRCSICRGELREAEELTRAMRSFRTPIPPDVAQRMEARLKATVGEKEYARAVYSTSARENDGLLTFPRRKLLTGTAAVAAAAGVALLARKSRADELDDTVKAMSGVASAYAVGRATTYRVHNTKQEWGVTAPVEYWFRSQDYYRRSTGDESLETDFYPQSIYIRPGLAVNILNVQGRVSSYDLTPEQYSRDLANFDIFSARSMVRRIARVRGGNIVSISDAKLNGVSAHYIRIQGEQAAWELWADRDSHLVIRSHYISTFVRDGQLTTEYEETLDRYEYGIDIPLSTFDPPAAEKGKTKPLTPGINHSSPGKEIHR